MDIKTDRNFVERMTWDDRPRAASVHGASAILPIGAARQAACFHLPLNTDRVQARVGSPRELAEMIDALIWPTLSYGHYPAFVEYAGSISLSAPVFEAVVQQIAAGILGHGCRAPVRARHRHQHAGRRSNARLAQLGAGDALHLRIHEGPRLSQSRHGPRGTEPRQPCRRGSRPR